VTLPDVWVFRWWESTNDGTSKRRKAIVGTVEAFPTEASALKVRQSVAHRRQPTNPAFRRWPGTIAELVAYYWLKELVVKIRDASRSRHARGTKAI
jgi:hypothetical protein